MKTWHTAFFRRYLYKMYFFDLAVTLNRTLTLGINPCDVQGTYLAWMPSINKQMPSKVI